MDEAELRAYETPKNPLATYDAPNKQSSTTPATTSTDRATYVAQTQNGYNTPHGGREPHVYEQASGGPSSTYDLASAQQVHLSHDYELATSTNVSSHPLSHNNA